MKRIKQFLLLLIFTNSVVGKSSLKHEWTKTHDGGGVDKPLLLWEEDLGIIREVMISDFYDEKKLLFRSFSQSGRILSTQKSKSLLGDQIYLSAQDKKNRLSIITKTSNCDECSLSLVSFNRYGLEKWQSFISEAPKGLIIGDGKLYTIYEKEETFEVKAISRDSGRLKWETRVGGAKNLISYDVNESGDLYLGGSSLEINKGILIAKIKHRSGTLSWTSRYTEKNMDHQDILKALKVNKDSEIHIIGEAMPGTMAGHLYIAQFDDSGNFKWQTRLASTGGPATNGRFSSLFLDEDDRPTVITNITDFYNANPNAVTKRVHLGVFNSNGSSYIHNFPNDEDFNNPDINEEAILTKLDSHGNFFILAKEKGFYTLTKTSKSTGKPIFHEILGSTNEFKVRNFIMTKEDQIIFSLTKENDTTDSVLSAYSQN